MTSPDSGQAFTQPAGSSSMRGRIVIPSPPAPVPRPRVTQSAQITPGAGGIDKSKLKGNAPLKAGAAATTDKAEPREGEKNSDAQVVRAGGSMAIATLISRITGFIRTVLITSSLGAAIASAFQTANQIPNLITEIVRIKPVMRGVARPARSPTLSISTFALPTRNEHL